MLAEFWNANYAWNEYTLSSRPASVPSSSNAWSSQVCFRNNKNITHSFFGVILLSIAWFLNTILISVVVHSRASTWIAVGCSLCLFFFHAFIYERGWKSCVNTLLILALAGNSRDIIIPLYLLSSAMNGAFICYMLRFEAED